MLFDVSMQFLTLPKVSLPPRSCELAIIVDTAQQSAKLPFMQQMLKACILELRDTYAATSVRSSPTSNRLLFLTMICFAVENIFQLGFDDW